MKFVTTSKKLCPVLQQFFLDEAIFILENTAGVHCTYRGWDYQLRDWVVCFDVRDYKLFAFARIKYGI